MVKYGQNKLRDWHTRSWWKVLLHEVVELNASVLSDFHNLFSPDRWWDPADWWPSLSSRCLAKYLSKAPWSSITAFLSRFGKECLTVKKHLTDFMRNQTQNVISKLSWKSTTRWISSYGVACLNPLELTEVCHILPPWLTCWHPRFSWYRMCASLVAWPRYGNYGAHLSCWGARIERGEGMQTISSIV